MTTSETTAQVNRPDPTNTAHARPETASTAQTRPETAQTRPDPTNTAQHVTAAAPTLEDRWRHETLDDIDQALTDALDGDVSSDEWSALSQARDAVRLARRCVARVAEVVERVERANG